MCGLRDYLAFGLFRFGSFLKKLLQLGIRWFASAMSPALRCTPPESGAGLPCGLLKDAFGGRFCSIVSYILHDALVAVDLKRVRVCCACR